MKITSLVLLTITAIAVAQPPHPNVYIDARQGSDGELIHLTTGTLRIKPCGNGIVRVTFVEASSIPDLGNPVLPDSACANAAFTVEEGSDALQIATPDLTVVVRKNSGAVTFEDSKNRPVLAETDWPFPRSIVATITDGHPAKQASTWFALEPDERLYGLGQHQSGILNQRNLQLELSQDNTNISVPFYISSKGYGLLWNNGSVTDWNNRFRPVLAIQSNEAEAVDYYYFAGPSFDKIIAEYRKLTGSAPLFPEWAYGYWQSKLAYANRDQLVSVATKYRALHIPIDNLVLDAGWETVLGSRSFNPHYPDPKSMVQTLHDQHIHLMVSIWPLFQPGNPNFEDLDKAGYFVTPGPNHLPAYLPGGRLYDAFSPGARQLYWKQTKESLYDIGVDAFWMDSTEPADLYAEEHGPMLADAKTALGNGSKYANLFPLMTTASVYDGQRAEPGNKRVFILTRSAFSGMQRNAAAAWSGDSLTTFDTFKRQIPAGLNYSMSGLPYWTTDIGGFVGGDTTDPAYRELFVRWFEYGAFCPIFRAHGARRNNQNELWSFGRQAQEILTKYDKLRYRLMPYIYTFAARTTMEGYTPMRALAFDFANDAKALDIGDEFMFGPSLLVAPVTDQGAIVRDVYLPAGSEWYDFWSGKRFEGGQTIHRAAPLAVLPLYVRAGSILPLGPEEEYVGQHPSAPIELRIYPGADGDASLYSDDGLTYGYEKGQYSAIPIHWDDSARVLTLEASIGMFSGDPSSRQFVADLVAPGHANGVSIPVGGHTVTYKAARQQIHLAP